MSSTTSHVIHVGNFHLRLECEQAARDASGQPSLARLPITPPSIAYAYDQRVVMPSPPPV